ncbi:hypothetical protein M2352_003896 [Azospirillum fermentarium]|uniref:hypothetical protein n=1 Tax=Azospirillum fermentarium TaxID=1233114 RepID=UPI002225FF41|nr:hypothetical protein [Azospirillum fermentarium]MCW2248262.1 hypothetical protein [Azospirillum fermentarium]
MTSVPSLLSSSSPVALYLEPTLFRQAWEASKLIAAAPHCPAFYRNKPEACFIAIDIAEKLQLPLFTVLQNTYEHGGRPGFYAQFLIGLANHRKAFATPIKFSVTGSAEAGDLEATAYATLHDGTEAAESVSLKTAIADGWYGRNAKYRSIPDRMLKYRAASALIGFYAPEVKLGFPTIEELEDGAFVDAVPLPDGSFGVPAGDRPVRPEPTSHEGDVEKLDAMRGAPRATASAEPPKPGKKTPAKAGPEKPVPTPPVVDVGAVIRGLHAAATSGESLDAFLRYSADALAAMDDGGRESVCQAERIARERIAAVMPQTQQQADTVPESPAPATAPIPADTADAKPAFVIRDATGEQVATYTQAKRAADSIIAEIGKAGTADDVAAILDHNADTIDDLPDEHTQRVQDAAAERVDAVPPAGPVAGPMVDEDAPIPADDDAPSSRTAPPGAYAVTVPPMAGGQGPDVTRLFALLKTGLQKIADRAVLEDWRDDNIDRLELVKAHAPAWAKALSDMLQEKRVALA